MYSPMIRCQLILQILKDNSTSAEALIGRGTAHAFERKLEAAIKDFSKVFWFYSSKKFQLTYKYIC